MIADVRKRVAISRLAAYFRLMSVEDLERAAKSLEPSDFKEFRRRITDYDMMLWDEQIEKDSTAGRLDGLISKAMEAYRAGRCTDL